MPNGIPSPKALLQQQAQLPKTALSGTPLAQMAQGVSGVMSQIAGALPDLPAVPGAPGAAAMPAGLPDLGNVQNLLKGVEAALPQGLPKLSARLPGPGTTQGPSNQGDDTGNPYPPRRPTGLEQAVREEPGVADLPIRGLRFAR